MRLTTVPSTTNVLVLALTKHSSFYSCAVLLFSSFCVTELREPVLTLTRGFGKHMETSMHGSGSEITEFEGVGTFSELNTYD